MDRAAQLAVDLNGHVDLRIAALRLVIRRPGRDGADALEAVLLPDLVADVRRKRAEQLQERFELGSVAAVVRQGGRQRHERGQRGVALERIDVRRDLADRLVQDGLVLGRVCRLVIGDGLGQIPDLVEKALAALHGVRRPGGGLLEIADGLYIINVLPAEKETGQSGCIDCWYTCIGYCLQLYRFIIIIKLSPVFGRGFVLSIVLRC